MNVKEAIAEAKKYICHLYADEEISHVGLEEVVIDDDVWKITIGFSRPWDLAPKGTVQQMSSSHQPMPRTYKIVIVKDSDGEVLALKHRVLAVL